MAVKLPARFSPQLCTAAQMQNTAAGGAGETNTQQHIHGTNLPAIFRQFSARQTREKFFKPLCKILLRFNLRK
nr:MAG TPA: hypothetical protein [Caudoviricetes sp.]